jgi:hypothetical protein
LVNVGAAGCCDTSGTRSANIAIVASPALARPNDILLMQVLFIGVPFRRQYVPSHMRREASGCNTLSQGWTLTLLWRILAKKRGKTMRFAGKSTKLVFAVVALCLTGTATIMAQGTVDVTGNWTLEVNTQAGGTTMPTVTLKQDGEKLTGHYSSQTLGEADITGTVKGQQIEFGFDVEVQGFALHVIYTGTVTRDTMKGKISLGELGDGTFTGKKQ